MQAVPKTVVSSSVPLQVLLYFNCWFSALILPAWLGVIIYKAMEWEMKAVFYYVNLAIFPLWLLAEFCRLWFGYAGNLQEKVPHIFSFVLMSAFPCFPVAIYFGILQPDRTPFEFVVGVIMLLFLVAELVFGFQTARVFIRKQTAKFFRACQEEQEKHQHQQ